MSYLLFLCTIFFSGIAANSRVCESGDDALFRRAVEAPSGKIEIVVNRISTVGATQATSPGGVSYVEDHIIDAVEIHVTGLEPEAERLPVWNRTHRVPGTDPFLRMRRLLIYDVEYVENVVWVLYSLDSHVYIERVSKEDGVGFTVRESVHITTQRDSGVRPYLLESGRVVLDDSRVLVAFKTFGSSSAVRGRKHPYEFWRIENGGAVEVENPETIDVLRDRFADSLEDTKRPRMSEQIRQPRVDLD